METETLSLNLSRWKLIYLNGYFQHEFTLIHVPLRHLTQNKRVPFFLKSYFFIFSLKNDLISFCTIFIYKNSSSVCCCDWRRQNVKDTADELQKIWTEAWSRVWKTVMLTSKAQNTHMMFNRSKHRGHVNRYLHWHCCRKKEKHFGHKARWSRGMILA